MLTHPGVYCLRSNKPPGTRQAHTYTMLTDLEAVFRTQIGAGASVFHHKRIEDTCSLRFWLINWSDHPA